MLIVKKVGPLICMIYKKNWTLVWYYFKYTVEQCEKLLCTKNMAKTFLYIVEQLGHILVWIDKFWYVGQAFIHDCGLQTVWILGLTGFVYFFVVQNYLKLSVMQIKTWKLRNMICLPSWFYIKLHYKVIRALGSWSLRLATSWASYLQWNSQLFAQMHQSRDLDMLFVELRIHQPTRLHTFFSLR